MYQIIATDDFVSMMKDIPLKHVGVLSQSFISIKKIKEAEKLKTEEYDFLSDLLSQIKNQEIE